MNDIQYAYEAHKALFLKAEGLLYRDWGNGYGDISPHSDDLYEDGDTALLALTVCRDETKTPTAVYKPYDLISGLDDAEIEILQSEPYIFKSGKNVDIHKEREHMVLSSVNNELYVNLDFRIDSVVGERMIAKSDRGARILKKMR
ncbi:MAG: hypothetical protein EPN70_02440 [Paraburkholderia sp.]|uniref:hypothetical protein n=1 Tax=Paraburkholderia sp. TaxID=1926495 RepID=UPI0011FCA9B3|nr:hypothetical protein [Paraburkholderia sp.]TAM07552.1 MAG: hypothetical protein EPN70_02440 [Paraburkholderia sp.]TAM29677.1 MAG: hypothetical protein EPN59_12100 [Paraburkholderia sp.]